MEKFNAKIIQTNDSFKLYVNDLVHVCFKQTEFIGFHSYLEGDNNKTYFIEFILKSGNKILCEYGKLERWELILDLLDKEVF